MSGGILVSIVCLIVLAILQKKKKTNLTSRNVSHSFQNERLQSSTVRQTTTGPTNRPRLDRLHSLLTFRQTSQTDSLYSFDTALHNSTLVVQPKFTPDDSKLPTYDEHTRNKIKRIHF